MAKTIKYGIVGFSRNQFDKKAAFLILDKLFEVISKKHKNKEVEIVSGYTNTGIPKIAYELADKYGFTTVGFSAKQALSTRSGVYPVKKIIIKGKKFGDESLDFIKYIDGLIRIGGGQQSRRETEMFKSLHKEKTLTSLLKEYEVDWFGSKTKMNDSIITIKGLTLIENFISLEYHNKLIQQIDKQVWSNELRKRVQHYGYKYDYRARSINKSMKVDNFPEWVNPITEKLIESKILTKKPDQLIINEYLPGQGISKHIDCEPCFRDKIISISLGSTAIMNFTNPKEKNQQVPIVLNPQSAVILQGESRYNWMHEIPGRRTDMINGIRQNRKRRISLTFRHVILNE